VATLVLAGCGGGSGQSGSAFTFLSVDGFTQGGSTPVDSVRSSVEDPVNTVACAVLRNNLKNPTLTGPTSLDNVTIQSYTVRLTAADGTALPGPYTVNTAVLVPAGTVASGVVSGNTAVVPVIVVPAGAKVDPRLRPPTRFPFLATAQVTFRGRDGRGQSVQTDGALTVNFVDSGTDATVTCGSTAAAA
jgi:hypothetical protein